MLYSIYCKKELSNTGCDDIYPGFDDMNTVCVNVIAWCDNIKSGCDVICSAYGVLHIEAVMTYIHFFS